MAEIGLFPLELVLLPTERVPLHIFEDRYKELIGECMALDRTFGLVFADERGLREIGTHASQRRERGSRTLDCIDFVVLCAQTDREQPQQPRIVVND